MYRTIFVDFDDVLYIHEDHWTKEENANVELEYVCGKRKYNLAYINNTLIDKLYNIRKDYSDVSIIMLTTARYNKYFDLKVDFIKYYAKDIFTDYWGVSSSEEKIHIIKAHCYSENFDNEEKALLIDDNIFTCANANKEGIKAVTPQFFEKYFHIHILNEITF